VQLPVIAERGELCSDLVGEEWEALYKKYTERRKREHRSSEV